MNKKKDNTYPLRLRAGDDPRIAEFLNSQSGGYGDVIRYLIEKEIALNGVRDLTLIIPSRRNIDVLAATLISNDTNNLKTVAAASIKKDDIDEKEEKVEIAVTEVKNESEEQKNEVNTNKNIEIDDNYKAPEKNIDSIKEKKEEKQEQDDEDEIPSCYM